MAEATAVRDAWSGVGGHSSDGCVRESLSVAARKTLQIGGNNALRCPTIGLGPAVLPMSPMVRAG